MLRSLLILVSFLAAAVPFVATQWCPHECSCSGNQIDCTNAGLTQAPAGLWKDIQVLDLTSNNITLIHGNSFTGFPSLASLFLPHNALGVFDFTPFADLPKLISLDARFNNIQSIQPPPPDMHHTRWWTLHLEDNGLTYVDPDVLSKLPNLSSFFVDRNPLVLQKGKRFLNHPKLHFVGLSDTDASAIDEETFRGLPNLEILLMSNTKIQDIQDVFMSNPRLQFLDVGYNNITAIRAGTFIAKQMSTVMFHNNPLELLDLGAISGVMKNGGGLYIMNTPLACNCDYEDIYRWAQGAGVRLYANCNGVSRCSFL